jgi:hypothetical protein
MYNQQERLKRAIAALRIASKEISQFSGNVEGLDDDIYDFIICNNDKIQDWAREVEKNIEGCNQYV